MNCVQSYNKFQTYGKYCGNLFNATRCITSTKVVIFLLKSKLYDINYVQKC